MHKWLIQKVNYKRSGYPVAAWFAVKAKNYFEALNAGFDQRIIMTPYGQPNYRVVYEEILMRLQEVPTTTHEKIAQYDTSLSGCKCPGWIERGGAYLYKLNGQYFTQCKHMAYIRAAVQPANQFIGQKAPEPPFCARPLPNLGAAA